MPIVSSRVKEGQLTFGGATPVADFSCQPSNIRLTPTTDTEDPLETLCGDSIAGTGKTTWQMQGSAVQDFDDVDGFVAFCFDNNGDTVPFTWKPNATSPTTWTGNLIVQAVEIGGDVNTRLTTDFTFDINGTPVRTP